MTGRVTCLRAAATAALLFIIGLVPVAAQPASLRLRIIAAEDARATDDRSIAPMREGLTATDPQVQRIAVRALGRLEEPRLVAYIEPMLSAPDAAVRVEAANALAQAYYAEADGSAAAAIARRALASEQNPLVRGALLLTLGRLRYPTPDAWRDAEALLVDHLHPSTGGSRAAASPAVLLNGLRGMQALARQMPKDRQLHRDTVTALTANVAANAADEAGSTASPTSSAAAYIRVLALQALRAGRVDDPALFSAWSNDPDAAVRRIAASVVFAAPLVLPATAASTAQASDSRRDSADVDRRTEWQSQALQQRHLAFTKEPNASVRLEAIRGYLQRAPVDFAFVKAVLEDASPHVALTVLDNLAGVCSKHASTRSHASDDAAPNGDADAGRALATACSDGSPLMTRVFDLASGRAHAPSTATWHMRAHALVSLAHLDPERARPLARTAIVDANPWLRAYAARAFARLLDAATPREHPDAVLLRRLTADADVNAATAAVEALNATLKHTADEDYLAVLRRDDRRRSAAIGDVPIGHELMLAAVAALDGSPRSDVVLAFLDALDRISAERRETMRDVRVALMTSLAAHVDASHAARLARYRTDFDPKVASLAAGVLTRLTGTTVVAAPARLDRAPLPTDADLERLSRTVLVFDLASGGRVTFRLLPDEAPVTAFRVTSLARRGYYTGLTVHRVVPNFVLQGGSPGANEHDGDSLFLRDEVGLPSHVDGTLGISTRGRDTGDAQFFINLIHNTRLDHTYTVFARVESGRDILDRVLEGETIAKVTVQEQ